MKRNDYFILAFAGIVLAAIFITPADGAQITNAFARIFIDGVNVFNAKSYNDPLEFVSGTGISISPSAPNRITISSTAGPGGDTNTAQIGDAGTHTSIFSSRFNATKNLLKTFVCDGTVSCTTNTTDIRITGTSATAYNKINNLDGGDAKIVATNATLSNTQATFKTLTAGTGISLTNGSKTVTISSTVSTGITELNSMNGGDARLLKSNSTTEGVFKSLTAGSNIGITNGTNTITISASIPASITSINAQTGPAITIQGTSRNVTVASAGNIITLNLGDKAVTYDGTQTLTSKTMDGTLNTFLNIAQASITNLVSDLASKQAKSEKGQSNGYASLNSNTLVPSRELGSGSNTSSTYLRGDRTWATISSTDTNTAQIVSAGGVSIFKQRDNATQNTLYGLAAVAGNTTLTTGATTITINTGYNVMTTTGSNQTVYHSLNITAGNKLQSTPNSKWASLNIGTLSADPTRLRQGDMWISGSLHKYNDNTNTTRTIEIQSNKGQSNGYASLNSNTLVPSRELGSGSNTSSTYLRGDRTWATISGSGYTKINNLDGGDAKIVATNTTLSNTQATFKSLTQGTGITLTNGSKTVTITNAGVTSISGTANNITASASTGAVTLNLGSNVVTTNGVNQTMTKSLNFTSGQKVQMQSNGKWASLNIGTTSSDPTRLRQGDLWISGSSLKYQDNTNTTKTVSTGSGSGYTKINGLLGGNARIVATNTTLSNTQATFKSIANGTGLFVVNGSKTLTFAANGHEQHRWGSFVPTAATTQGDGFLATSFTLEGTETLTYNTTRGVLSIDTTTGAGGLRIAGVLSNATNFNIFRGDQNSYLYIEAAPFGQTVAGGNRLFIGFQSGQTFQPKNADTIVNAISAFGVCVRTTDTTFQRCENDGAGTGTYTSLGVSTNTNWHTFKIYALNSGTQWCVEIDRQDASCATTDIPASTQRMYLNALATQQPSTTTKTFRYGYIYVQNDR